MKYQIRAYLLLIGQVALGFIILLGVRLLKIKSAPATEIIFLVFFLLNMLYASLFHLKQALSEYWSLRNIPLLPIGALAGLLLAGLPLISATIFNVPYTFEIKENGFAYRDIYTTFLVIGWEELWFRSLLLNYAERYMPKIAIAIVMGILFMLLHAMNPKISLAHEGPMLALAGILLTTLYFYFRSIWVPVGLHLGNNLLTSSVHTSFRPGTLFSDDGYIYTGALLLLTIIFLFLLWKKQKEKPWLYQGQNH